MSRFGSGNPCQAKRHPKLSNFLAASAFLSYSVNCFSTKTSFPPTFSPTLAFTDATIYATIAPTASHVVNRLSAFSPLKMASQMDTLALAKLGLQCLDLTSLNDNDTDAAIKTLCTQAKSGPAKTAAVCVYPQFVALAKAELKDTDVKVATVVNFPAGDSDAEKVAWETRQAAQDGADEIDVVWNFEAYNAGRLDEAMAPVKAVCQALEEVDSAGSKRVKVIFETGAIPDGNVEAAAGLVLGNYPGSQRIQFLKTSTGKLASGKGASHGAVDEFAKAIKTSKKDVGIKVSGGVRSTQDALAYLTQAEKNFGIAWITPGHFRFGASGLWGALSQSLGQKDAMSAGGTAY